MEENSINLNKRKECEQNDNDSNDQSVFKIPKTNSKHKSNSLMVEQCSQEGKNVRKVNFHSLDQYTRHKMLVNYYRLTHAGTSQKVFQRDCSRDKTDFDVLVENHQFIWSDEDLNSDTLTWGQRVAKKYYDRLFKEYCIVDLSLYKENKFGMRWRTETEVIQGKGQFICGGKRCQEKENLTSWEVLFGYLEHGEKKSCLVKLRLCPDCSTKLNYHKQNKKAKKAERKLRKSIKSKESEFIKQIKEEIYSEDEQQQQLKNNQPHEQEKQLEETYEDLVDKIWRQPVRIEDNNDDNDDERQKEKELDNDMDEYLNEFFM